MERFTIWLGSGGELRFLEYLMPYKISVLLLVYKIGGPTICNGK
jgi:hypothetical protein